MIAVPFVMSSVLMVRDKFAILPVLVQGGEIFQKMPEWAHFSQRGCRRWQKACTHKMDPKIPTKTSPLPTCMFLFLILQIVKAFPKRFPTKMKPSEKKWGKKSEWRGEERKGRVNAVVSLWNPNTISKFWYLCVPKLQKLTFCIWNRGALEVLDRHIGFWAVLVLYGQTVGWKWLN